MSKLAKKIEIRRSVLPGSRLGEGEEVYSLKIDGEEFPWYTTSEGPAPRISRGEMPAVAVLILAEQVVVIDTVVPPGEE